MIIIQLRLHLRSANVGDVGIDIGGSDGGTGGGTANSAGVGAVQLPVIPPAKILSEWLIPDGERNQLTFRFYSVRGGFVVGPRPLLFLLG